MTRPPPLQLQLDNNFSVRPRSWARSFFTQIYQANWRNIVIAVAVINALRFFFSASNAFQDVGVDNMQHVPKLAKISTALGAMYITTAVIEVYGALSASMQRLKLIRIYAHLAFFSALLVTVAGFIAGVAYFVHADDLVHQCVLLSTSGKLKSKSIFRGQPWPIHTLSAKVAQETCLGAWDEGSMYQVTSIFVFSLIPSLMYFFVAYTYYRQTTDPNHPANLCTGGRRSAIRMEAFPDANYSPLYSGSAPPYSDDITDAINGSQHRARTPKRSKSSVKPKRLDLSPMMRTASPYMLTPGPPSFAPSREVHPSGFFTIGSAEDDRFA